MKPYIVYDNDQIKILLETDLGLSKPWLAPSACKENLELQGAGIVWL